MELVLTGFTANGERIISIDAGLKPTTTADHLILAYLTEHPETIVKYPFSKKRKVR